MAQGCFEFLQRRSGLLGLNDPYKMTDLYKSSQTILLLKSDKSLVAQVSFKSVDNIVQCDNSIGNYGAVISWHFVCHSVL